MKENKKVEIMLIVLCILLVLPLFIISKYNRPSADDYDYSLTTHQVASNGGGIIDLIKEAYNTDIKFYNSWQGLYTTAFIMALQPGLLIESNYSYGAVIVMLTCFISLLISIHIINKNYNKKSFIYSICVSIIIFTILMLFLPNATEGLYWFNGAINYTPWVFINLLNICLLLEIFNNKSKAQRILLIIISSVISFLISGANHVTSFANILTLLIISVYLVRKKKYYSILPLLTAIIGFIIMYKAPGTLIRKENIGLNVGIFETIIQTIKYFKVTVSSWINLGWILSLLCLTPIILEIIIKNKEKLSRKFPFLKIIFCLMIECAMMCVPYYAMAYFGEGRLFNVLWIQFILMSVYIYFSILVYLSLNDYINLKKIEKIKHKSLIGSFVIISSLLVIFIIPNNSLTATNELITKEAKLYSMEMDERFKLYNDDSLKEVGVKPLKHKSTLLYFRLKDEIPNEEIHHAMSTYYNKTIYLKSEEN